MAEPFFYAPQADAVRKLLARAGQEERANPGLVWERNLPVWQRHPPIWTGKRDDGSRERDDTPKAQLHGPLSDFARDFSASRRQQADCLREHSERRQRALEHLARMRHGEDSWKKYFRKMDFQLVWRLATGLGADHPTENGFTFDTLTGAPYLAGSAVKGLCRRAAELDEMNEELIERLFGPANITAQDSGAQGALLFYDAVPVKWPTLAVDVVNCHHPAYYRSLMNKQRAADIIPPRETESPIPVFFLTVAEGNAFTFSIGAKPGAAEGDVDSAFRLLELGFEWLGIGAKTAVGYGEFKLAETPAQSTLAQLKAADPLQEFTDWFARQGFAQGRNKGQLGFVRQQVCRLPAELRASAIDHVGAQLRKALKAAELQVLLEKLRQPCG